MSSGGGGKGKSQTANYYMSVHYGICTQVDSINSLTVNETLVPEMEDLAGNKVGNGYMAANGTLICRQELLFGGWPKQGGLSGHVDYMLGGEDQGINTELADRVKQPYGKMPAFRGIASVLFRDAVPGYDLPAQKGFMWSSNMPTLPPVAVNVTRIPLGPNGVKRNRNGLANPSHIIYECLTDTDWGMGSPLGLIDQDSFDQCADTLDNEGFWLAMMWARSATIEAFISEVLDHIQGTLTTDPATGKMKLKLLRDDYDRTKLHIVHPGNANITKMQRKVWGETVNDVTVTWTNPDNEKEETVNAQDNGNIAIQGAVISTTRNYYGVRNADLALLLAYRDLKQSGTPLMAIECTVNRALWDAIVGDVVEVRWPEYGVASIIMRVGSINYGKTDDSTIVINLMEDIFGLGTAIFTDIPVAKPGDPAPTYPPPAPGTDIPPYIPPYIPTPQPNLEPEVGEAPRALENLYMDSLPYFLVAINNSDAAAQAQQYPLAQGMILANQPGTATSVIDVWSLRPSITGDDQLTRIGRLPNGGRGTIAIPDKTQTTLTIPSNWSGAGILAGQLLMVVSGEADNPRQEIMAVRSVTGNQLVVIRGILDTNPYTWPAGSPIWGIRLTSASVDPIERSDGEVVRYRFAPVTNRGTYDVSLAPQKSHEINERFYLPYRPVNLRIDGSASAPSGVVQPGAVLTWARRNRIMETAQVLSQTDQDVTPEIGQTTTILLVDTASGEITPIIGITGNTYTLTEDDLDAAPSGSMELRVYAQRGEYLSREFQTLNITTPGGGYGTAYGYSYGES